MGVLAEWDFEEDKVRVLLVSRDHHDLEKMAGIRRHVLKDVRAVDMHIVSGAGVSRKHPSERDVHYLREGLGERKKEYSAFSESDLLAELVKRRRFMPVTTYKADPRYRDTSTPERDLMIEQIHFCDELNNYLDKAPRPDVIFMTAGATIIRNACFLVAQAKGIRAYRMMPTHFLTPGREGPRFWFCSNNFSRISNDEIDFFDHEGENLRHHTEVLFEAIRSGQFRLSAHARSKREQRAALSWSQVAKDVLVILTGKDKGEARSRLRATANRVRNNRLVVTGQDLCEPYILFPLNVPGDAQLTLRAAAFTDLFSICQQILNVMPAGIRLVLREHPGAPGMLSNDQLHGLLKRSPQTSFVSGDTELSDLLEGASGVITINSTSGFEAVIADKPVLLLGTAFYRASGCVYDVDSIDGLAEGVEKLLADPLKKQRQKAARETLVKLLNQAWPPPGEVRGMDEVSVDECLAEGIAQRVEKIQAMPRRDMG